ncbi:reductive dehalogenase [Ancylomarina sp. DW003]|nr:reductive dehalogenase [Ancylomarina sp. DW003]MDE5422117.1 reductive dehalogenase [Ancylomarina sp. DW003]
MITKKAKDPSAINRRNFLKLGAAGAAIGAIAIPAKAKEGLAKKIDEKTGGNSIKTHDEFPAEVRDDYKQHSTRDIIFTGSLLGFHPEDEEVVKAGQMFTSERHNTKPGYDQLAQAMNAGGWALHHSSSPLSCFGVPNTGILSWNQSDTKSGHSPEGGEHKARPQYKFQSKADAANIIKRTARLYGADLIGISKRDTRWDYSEHIDPAAVMSGRMDEAVYGWEKFPFEPKSVIVMAFEMDYEAVSAAPSMIEGATVGAEYSAMTKVAHQVSVFLKELGYQAVPAGNDTGLSVPYAIAAGLGEGSRMGTLITYKYGPRVRLAKVYTDFDFVEYDKPVEFGAMDFCKNCKRCADACPGQAITYDTEPSFEPDYENAWFNAKGVKKYYMNARKCFNVWGETGSDCGSCIASCPYNKPDFWHHRLVDKITAAMPGPVHDFMREMDKAFGYGDIDNPEKIDQFFDAKGRRYNGH